MKFAVSSLALALLTTGCASVQIMPLEAGAEHDGREGYVFYAPQPYLAVAQAEHGGCSLSVVYLPNMGRPYRARVQGGLGSVAFSPKFENGWMLSEAGTTVDNNGDELLAAIGGLIPGATATEQGDSPQPEPCAVQGLYRMDFDEHQNLTLLKVFPAG